MAELPAAPSRPLNVPDKAWAEAVRREAAARPLPLCRPAAPLSRQLPGFSA